MKHRLICLLLLLAVSACAPPPWTEPPRHGDLTIVAPGDGEQVERMTVLLTGWARSDLAHFVRGADKAELVIPIPAFLVERADGYVLIDSGLAPSLATDPARYVGRFFACLAKGYLHRLVMRPEWAVPARLQALGVAGAQIKHVVLTHAHFDHTGANRAFLDATFHLTEAALDAGRHGGILKGYMDNDFPSAMKVAPLDFAGTPPFLTFAGSVDLFGDGSMIAVPLPGHSPGAIGVFVRAPSGPTLLVGDAAYLLRNFDEPRLIGLTVDDEAAWDTLCRLKRLQEQMPELRIVPFHDPEVFRSLPTAPEWF